MPDVAVVDISMPGLNGLEVISRLNLLHSKMPVLVVTMRELQVLRRLATGNTNREIATIYGISIKTVDTYRFRLLKKTRLAQQCRAVAVCHSEPSN